MPVPSDSPDNRKYVAPLEQYASQLDAQRNMRKVAAWAAGITVPTTVGLALDAVFVTKSWGPAFLAFLSGGAAAVSIDGFISKGGEVSGIETRLKAKVDEELLGRKFFNETMEGTGNEPGFTALSLNRDTETASLFLTGYLQYLQTVHTFSGEQGHDPLSMAKQQLNHAAEGVVPPHPNEALRENQLAEALGVWPEVLEIASTQPKWL
ncbi:MAG: hypothetical protein AAB971_00110 [Patescibacteria group bacterium]